MRRGFGLGSAIMMLTLCCHAQTTKSGESAKNDAPKPNFSLDISSPSNPVRLGSQLKVTLMVTNISGGEIGWESYRPDTAYRGFGFLLTKDGREVETTPYHRFLSGRIRPDDPLSGGAFSSIVFQVKPGTVLTEAIDLGDLYFVTEPGEYKLEVSRFDDSTKSTARSNALVLKIVR